MKHLIKRVGPCTLQPAGEPFAVLVRSIVSQLISTKAARSISAKVDGLCYPNPPNPHDLLSAGLDKIRACGLTQSKAAAIVNLAQAAVDGQLDFATLAVAEETIVTKTLLGFKGIGPWTVHVFLIFGLVRLNVLPLGDLGVRKAVQEFYGLEELPSSSEMRSRAVLWEPYCSVAAWYLWRSRALKPDPKIV